MALASCARVGGASRCTIMTRPELELEFELGFNNPREIRCIPRSQ